MPIRPQDLPTGFLDNAAQAAGYEAALAVARAHGRAEPGILLSSRRKTMTMRFEGTGELARVTFPAGAPSDTAAQLERAVAVAGHVADLGGPIGAPSSTVPPGPHVQGGFVVTFWRFYAGARSYWGRPGALGGSLRDLHQAARTYAGALPHVLDEVDDAVETVAADGRLRQEDRRTMVESLRLLRPQLRRRVEDEHVVHGDAHAGNVLDADGRLLWIDLEHVARGPVEWDLACLLVETRTLRRTDELETEALRAYGAVDRRLLESLLAYRVLEFAARTSLVEERDPTYWLEWLREHVQTESKLRA
ncbi:MAG: phosphotransferase family protein [Gaiellaceae bacterium]